MVGPLASASAAAPSGPAARGVQAAPRTPTARPSPTPTPVLAPRRTDRQPSSLPARRAIAVAAKKKAASERDGVSYGRSWFEQTRDPTRGRTVREEIERRRLANWEANGRKREREDLYTDNWDGSEYKGSANNVLTWILAAAVLAPVAGLVFAWKTYGVLWG